MKNIIALPFLFALALPCAAMAQDLRVATWGGSFTENQRLAYFAPFTEKTGVPVLDASYTGGLGQLRAMAEAGNITWDLVQMEAPELILACQEGLIERIDPARITVADKLGEAISECGVGANGWSLVMGYNSTLMPRAPTGWADFWNVAEFPGKRAMRRSAQYALEAALLADGVAPDQVYAELATPEGVDRAFAKLDELKSSIQWWEAGSAPAEWLASGAVVMASSYVGRLVDARNEGAPVLFSWQGSFYAVDSWAIVAGSDRVDQAYEFLNIASDAERQAAFSNNYPVAPTNPDADALVDPDRIGIMPVAANVAQGIRIDAGFWIDHAEALNERFNTWLSQ